MNLAMRTPIEVLDQENNHSRESAFGLWKGQTVYLPGETAPLPQDGLAYQEKMRAEWDGRFSGPIGRK
jgi:hypothetical protein